MCAAFVASEAGPSGNLSGHQCVGGLQVDTSSSWRDLSPSLGNRSHVSLGQADTQSLHLAQPHTRHGAGRTPSDLAGILDSPSDQPARTLAKENRPPRLVTGSSARCLSTGAAACAELCGGTATPLEGTTRAIRAGLLPAFTPQTRPRLAPQKTRSADPTPTNPQTHPVPTPTWSTTPESRLNIVDGVACHPPDSRKTDLGRSLEFPTIRGELQRSKVREEGRWGRDRDGTRCSIEKSSKNIGGGKRLAGGSGSFVSPGRRPSEMVDPPPSPGAGGTLGGIGTRGGTRRFTGKCREKILGRRRSTRQLTQSARLSLARGAKRGTGHIV